MPTYADALAHLTALGLELAPQKDGTRRKWDLAHMRTLAHALGDPQQQFPAILIAGTNGKGSTAATLASILATSGYRTGLYTSPHLERVTERIQIGGPSHLREIPEDTFARLFFHVDETARHLIAAGRLPHPPSFFETLTALAFLYFAQQKVDIAILEVGLGGRLDATNIVTPLLSLLTDIALDHQEYLGPTIAAITREKCGILRDGGTLITLPQHPEANQAIGEAAATLNLRALSAAAFIPHTPPQTSVILSEAEGRVEGPAGALTPTPYTLTLDNQALEVRSPLHGHHQQRNVALAVAAAQELRTNHHFRLPNKLIAEGIAQTRWPGRLEFIQIPNQPDLLLDVAHNPAGAWTLRAALAQLPEAQPRTLLFSCLQDKPLEEIARILFPLFDSSPDSDPLRRLNGNRDHLILTQIDSPRATPSPPSSPRPTPCKSPPTPHPTPPPPSPRPAPSPPPTASSSPPAASTSSVPSAPSPPSLSSTRRTPPKSVFTPAEHPSSRQKRALPPQWRDPRIPPLPCSPSTHAKARVPHPFAASSRKGGIPLPTTAPVILSEAEGPAVALAFAVALALH